MKFYASVSLFLFLGTFYSQAQYTETINSNRPGDSQGAFAVGTGVLQLESGLEAGKDRHHLLNTETSLWGIDYALRFGFIYEELEFNVTGSFLSQTTDYLMGSTTRNYTIQNFESNTLGVKYLVYDPYKNAATKKPNLYSWKANQSFNWSQMIPAVSLYAGLNFALGDNPYLYEGEGKVSPKVAVISQHNWEGGWVFVLNLIGNKLGQEYPTFMGIATLTHSLSSKFAAFGEFQGIMSDLYSDEILRGGMAYLFHEDFQLDFSGLVNFKNTPSRWQVALGLSYRFDMHSQDQYLEKPQ